MSPEDKIFCTKAEDLLMAATIKALPLRCRGKEDKLYMIPPDNKRFMSDASMSFPATRWSLTDQSNVLNIHLDRMNPDDYNELPDSFMN